MSLGYNQTEDQGEGLLLQNKKSDGVLEYLCEKVSNLEEENSAMRRVISHIAIRSNKTSYIEEKGIDVYAQFNVTRRDLIELIRDTSIVLKSGVYPHVNETFIRYDAFNHELDSKIFPAHATTTHFLLQPETELICVTLDDEIEIEDRYIDPLITEKVTSKEAINKISPVTGVYTVDDFDSIPKNFIDIVEKC